MKHNCTSKLLSLIIAILLVPALISASDASAEGIYPLGDGFLLLNDSGFQITDNGDGEYTVLTSDDRIEYGLIAAPVSEWGVSSGEALINLFSQMVGMDTYSSMGFAFIQKPYQYNEFTVVPLKIMADLGYGAAVINGDNMLLIFCWYGTTSDVDALLADLSPSDISTVTEPTKSYNGYVDYESISGYYDLNASYGLDTDINLILTPMGHGRLINSSGSIVFNYTIQDGKITTESAEFTMTVTDEDSILLESVYGSFLQYKKREPMAGCPIIGSWNAIAMETNGKSYNRALLELVGLSISFTAYDNGAVDWYAVSDTAAYTAQGWGVDSNEIYINNGAFLSYCSFSDDGMTMKLTIQSSGSITFERVED